MTWLVFMASEFCLLQLFQLLLLVSAGIVSMNSLRDMSMSCSVSWPATILTPFDLVDHLVGGVSGSAVDQRSRCLGCLAGVVAVRVHLEGGLGGVRRRRWTGSRCRSVWGCASGIGDVAVDLARGSAAESAQTRATGQMPAGPAKAKGCVSSSSPWERRERGCPRAQKILDCQHTKHR